MRLRSPHTPLPASTPASARSTLICSPAGQNDLGRKCTTLLENQCQEPGTGLDKVTCSRASTAARLVTGALNDTMIGIPAPTTLPSPGRHGGPQDRLGLERRERRGHRLGHARGCRPPGRRRRSSSRAGAAPVRRVHELPSALSVPTRALPPDLARRTTEVRRPAVARTWTDASGETVERSAGRIWTLACGLGGGRRRRLGAGGAAAGAGRPREPPAVAVHAVRPRPTANSKMSPARVRAELVVGCVWSVDPRSHADLPFDVIAPVVLEDEAYRRADEHEQPEHRQPPAEGEPEAHDRGGPGRRQRPPAVRAVEAELAGLVGDLPVWPVLGPRPEA